MEKIVDNFKSGCTSVKLVNNKLPLYKKSRLSHFFFCYCDFLPCFPRQLPTAAFSEGANFE